jgi:hypothetical protein
VSGVVSVRAASELFETTEMAMAVCGLPRYRSADRPGQSEVLKYLGDDDVWALVAGEGSSDEYIPVDPELASLLIMAHLRGWLLQRGYQVQAHCYATRRRWTLVDCLSPADGGGDRLDVDYPCGADELTVLVEAVLAVNTI